MTNTIISNTSADPRESLQGQKKISSTIPTHFVHYIIPTTFLAYSKWNNFNQLFKTFFFSILYNDDTVRSSFQSRRHLTAKRNQAPVQWHRTVLGRTPSPRLLPVTARYNLRYLEVTCGLLAKHHKQVTCMPQQHHCKWGLTWASFWLISTDYIPKKLEHNIQLPIRCDVM